jgi:hypothetical protein
MKRVACIILVATILVSGLFFGQNVHAQNTVNGTLSVNTEWTVADSPVNFYGTVTVGSGVILTIDPGVIVNLGVYYLLVEGTLTAQGNASNQIVFTDNVYSDNQPQENSLGDPIIFASSSTPWSDATNSGSIIQNAVLDGIYLSIDGASPKIDTCLFNFATGYFAPISIEGGSPVISNNTIDCTPQGSSTSIGVDISGGAPLIASNQFEGDFSGYSNMGVEVGSGAPVITNNAFAAEYGSNSDGVNVISGSPLINNNQFEGNGHLTGIVDSSSFSVTVSNNSFSSCLSGITAQAGSILTVDGNSFLRGTDGIDISSGASLTITNNLIDSNSHYGIDGGGNINSNTISNNQIGIHNPPTSVISDNNIVGNTENSITATIEDVNAQNNWWGITDTATINQTIYDSKDDFHLGTITFVPFSTQPILTAPVIPSYTPTITPIPAPVLTPTPTTEPVSTPTPTPDQYSQTFVYQVGTLINLNLITTATAIVLVIVWVIVILGYVAKRGISNHYAKN